MMNEVLIPVEHSVVDGLYTRIAYAKQGSLIVGCAHKKGGTAVLLSGAIRQIDGENKCDIQAPTIFNTFAGTQRIAYAITDCTYATMHSVNSDNVLDAEKELFEQEPQITRIRNSFNRLLLEHNISNEQVNEEMNDQITHFEYSNIYYISESIIDGLGTMLKCDVIKGDTIGVAIRNGNRTPLARYINHSDIPNAYFIDLENRDVSLIAMVDIEKGEEVLVDYTKRMV